MSGRINIPSSVTDEHYRYTRPAMKCVDESRLNGVKTNIRNLEDVAFALRVPPKPQNPKTPKPLELLVESYNIKFNNQLKEEGSRVGNLDTPFLS